MIDKKVFLGNNILCYVGTLLCYHATTIKRRDKGRNMEMVNQIKCGMGKRISAGILAVAIGMALFGCSGKQTQWGSAANRLEQIKQKGYIEVVTEPYFAPNEFIDSTKTGDDQYVGADIELAKYIADKLGVEAHIIPLEFSAVLSSITEGKYDLAISALAYTPERAEAMTLSKGYYFAENEGYGFLVRQEDVDKYPDTASYENAVVVCQSGSLQEAYVTSQIPKCKEIKRVSATTDGFLMVQEGKADAAATYIGTAKLYAEANPGVTIANNFRFVVDQSTEGTRIGMPKDEPELENAINEIIDELLESGQFEQWMEEYSEYARSLGIE